MTWTEYFNDSIRTAEQLSKKLLLSEQEQQKIETIIRQFPMQIPAYYFSLIRSDDPKDPIARMCIPSDDELDPGGSFDTSGESSNTPQAGIQHKYRQTALILATNTCAMYCRHCFRKRMVGLSEEELNKQVEDAARYVCTHPEVNNVLITGGDALMLPNQIIRRYLEELCPIKSLDFLRFGSRIPVVLPQRIYMDQELLDLFSSFSKRKTIFLVTQFNHPHEITAESTAALTSLQECGIQIRNQTVLLRGVNDSPETLGLLLRRLTSLGVNPYYVFQCRPVTGVKGRFQVPLLEGVRITDAAKALQNGIGKSFRYAMSHPRGKIEILGELTAGKMLFRFHQNKYPEDSAKLFVSRITPEDTWLDDDLIGF